MGIRINYRRLFLKLANDLSLDPGTIQYCVNRLEKEGIQFLTVTLPTLSKSVLASLEHGSFLRPTNFAWKGRSLRFFRSLLDEIFDKNGKVLPEPCPVAIMAIRQLCEYFYKLALSFTAKQLQRAESRYEEVEHAHQNFTYDSSYAGKLRRFIARNYPAIYNATVNDIFSHSRPRFGPGAFSGSRDLPERFHIWKQMSDAIVGTTRASLRAFAGFFKPYPSSPERVHFVDESLTCEVLFVPKDSRGPRVISKEPMHLVRAQLGFFDWCSKTLENTTSLRVNFADQSTNRELARRSSLNKRNATLDLKDASDRVNFKLMKELFRHSPGVYYFLTKIRSTEAILPLSQRRLVLRKLSGMGSGLTFPLMALLIHASISFEISRSTALTDAQAMNLVYVYGDDVVVPVEYYTEARRALEKVGLKLNPDKCFIHSHFRESCGGDYFKGQDVAPVRLRLPGGNPEVADGHINLKSHMAYLEVERHCRELVQNGLTRSADYLYTLLEGVLGSLPEIKSPESPVLGRLNLLAQIGDEPVRAFVPVPVTDEVGRIQSEYKYLSSKLVRTQANWKAKIFAEGSSSEFGVVSCPRSVKLIKKRVFGVERRSAG